MTYKSRMMCAGGSAGFLLLVIASTSLTMESIYTTEGQAALLKCEVDDDSNATVIWAHNNQSLDTSNPQIRQQGAMLLLLSAAKGDNGTYTCRESLQSPVASEICLMVGSELCPQPSKIWPAQQGTNHTLMCGLEDISEIALVYHISWKKDCKTVDSVHFINIVPSDAGNYTCVNNFTYEGKSYIASHTTLLKVKNDPPLKKPSITYPLQDTVYVIPDQPVNLTCIASLGYNEETVSETESYWQVNNSHIDEKQGLTNHQHIVRENGTYFSVNILSIQEFQQDFFDLSFQCIFLNSLGQDYKDVRLKPLAYRTFNSSLCSLAVLILLILAALCRSLYHRYNALAASGEDIPLLP